MYCSSHFKNPQLQIVRAEKQYLIDHLGIQYLDCISNTAHVGHCHPQVVGAAQSQLSRTSTTLGFSHDSSLQYTKQLLSTAPDTLSVCYLVNSGSEANDLALRLARSFTNAQDVVVLDDAYHGNLGNLIEVSPKVLRVQGIPKKDHVHILPQPDSFRGSINDEDKGTWENYLREAHDRLTKVVESGRCLAAFISESFGVNSGVLVPPGNFFRDIYELIRSLGGVCIADEVQTGLGRVGECMWGFQHFGVIPDIVTVGKPLGNGYPMGAVLTTPDIADALGEYFSTFGGNPVACAIGLSVLEVIANEKLMASGKAVGRTLLEGLRDLKAKHSAVGDVRGRGLCIGIDIVCKDKNKKPDPETAEIISSRLKHEHRIVVSVQGTHLNVLMLTPPMCFTQQNARSFVHALDQVLSTPNEQRPSSGSCGSLPLSLGLVGSLITPESLGNLSDDDMPSFDDRRKRLKTSYDDVD